ncbi:MAG: hypothetical protein M3416_02775 [Acidobacteriota bacterium]|nr:hypothetical protein [Acidobacteriota bacterium]
MDFEQWLAEVRSLLVELGFCRTPEEAAEYSTVEEWRLYFEGGYPPRQAVNEEFSYA